jgi:hypothetical protein
MFKFRLFGVALMAAVLANGGSPRRRPGIA